MHNAFIKVILVILSFYILFPSSINAQINEEFSKTYTEKVWTEIDDDKDIHFSDNTIVLENISGSMFPYVYSDDLFDGLESFIITIRFRYIDNFYNVGSGINIGREVYTERINRQPFIAEHLFRFWPLQPRQFVLATNLPKDDGTCISDCFAYQSGSAGYNDWHTFKIVYDDNYRIYVDGKEVYKTINTSLVPKYIWFGNPENIYHSVVYSDFEIDYIRITPLEEEKKALVLIPGLGASWSTEGFFYNDNSSNWSMMPLVDTYNNFSQSALQLGWETDNYYVWNYDWRKPLDEIAIDFDNYLEENVDEEKIDIVGHSLGGLVARTWKQNYDNKNISDKVITVGSPHKGVVQAYEALAGGKLPDYPFFQGVAMRLLMNILGAGYLTDADFLRNEIPVLKDISPTFDFIKKDGEVYDVAENYFYNDYLSELNDDLDDVGLFSYLSGATGINTPRWLVLENRNLIDTILNLWPDGFEINTEDDIGDGTVSLMSSFLGSDCLHQLELDHGEIISDEAGLEEIFSLLLDKDVELNLTNSKQDKAFFYLASPATLMVNNVEPDNPQEQFVVLPYENEKDYDVKIIGTGNGDFHLSYGYILENENDYELKTIKGKISEGETKSFSFNDELNLDLLNMLGIIRNNLDEINGDANIKFAIKEIDQAEKLIKKNKDSLAVARIKNAMRKISNYRNKLKPDQVEEFNIAFNQMNSLAEILNTIERKSSFDLLRKNFTDMKIKTAERKIELNKKRNKNVFMDALSLHQALDLISETELFSGDIFEIDLLLNEAIK